MEFFRISIDWKWGSEADYIYVGREKALEAFDKFSNDNDVTNALLYECHISDDGRIVENDSYRPMKTIHN